MSASEGRQEGSHGPRSESFVPFNCSYVDWSDAHTLLSTPQCMHCLTVAEWPMKGLSDPQN